MKYVCIGDYSTHCAVGNTPEEAFREYVEQHGDDDSAEDLEWYELGERFEVETKIQKKQVIERKSGNKLPK